MNSLSEYTLFKHCVEKPFFLDKSLTQLNLKFIKDPAAPPQLDGCSSASRIGELTEHEPLETLQRKALRLYHMVWSGMTKCMRNMVQSQRKALEISDFAIFGAVSEKNQGRDPMNKGYLN